MCHIIEALPDSYARLGEGPHWDCETQSLYYTDLIEPALHRYDYELNKIYKTKLENETYASFIIPIENSSDQFAVGCGHNIKIVEWDGKSDKCKVLSNYCSVESGNSQMDNSEMDNIEMDNSEMDNSEMDNNRFNDGKCDPFGRLYAGTMHSNDYYNHQTGSLYLCNSTIPCKRIISNLGISNGLTWDLKRKKFYFIDSLAYNVKVFDYDEKTGSISNENIFIDFRKDGEQTCLPDGMTIDEDGHIYVAFFNGSKICKINPNGYIELEIEMNCKQITSLAFGGPCLDTLFVTTANLDNEPAPAGQTFKITNLCAKGLLMNKFNIAK